MPTEKRRAIIYELRNNFLFIISKFESKATTTNDGYNLIDDYIGMFYDTQHFINNDEDDPLITFSINYANVISHFEQDKMLDSLKVIVSVLDKMLVDLQ